MNRTRDIPSATVARLALYIRALAAMAEDRVVWVSSEQLAAASGVNAAKVRKDLSYLGSYGTRGVGYAVEDLFVQISRRLGATQECPVAIVGIGNLGRALVGYRGFSERGFRIAALFDIDPSKIGKKIAGVEIQHTDELPATCRGRNISVAIITTPALAGQEVADRLAEAGVGAVLNFSPVVLVLPSHVHVRKVDLSIELQVLAYYLQHRDTVTPQVQAAERV